MANVNYLKSFSEYDSEKISNREIDGKQLQRVSFAIKNNNNILELQERRDRALANKISKLLPIIRAAEKSVNTRLNSLSNTNIKVKNFKLSTYLSVESLKNNPSGVMTKLNFNKLENQNSSASTVNLNINVNKFLKYSSVEAYSILTSSLYKSVLGSEDLQKVANNSKQNLNSELSNISKDNANGKFGFIYNLARYKVREYVKNFIKDYKNNFPESVDEKEITEKLLKDGLSNEMIENIANDKFDLKRLESDIKILGNYSSLEREEKKSVVSNSREPQTWLVNNSSLRDQALDLLGKRKERATFVSEQMVKNDKLKSSFESIKGMFTPEGVNQSPQNMANLQTFCKDFTESYMNAQGLNSIEIRFINDKSNPAIGEYFDAGKSQYIEVNLSKVNNMLDLTTTLAHELTHAVESSINKSNGEFNKNGGGIKDSISTNISNSGLTGNAYKLLKDLNYYCYKVDPCESRARDGEQIGADFVKKLAGNEYEAEINNFEKTNAAYLNKVQEIYKNLDKYIAEFESKLSSLSITGNSKGYAMITERLEYLKERKREYDRNLGTSASSKKPVNKVEEVGEERAM